MKPSILIIGFSHIGAVMRAVKESPPHEFNVLSLNLNLDERHRPLSKLERGQRVYNAAVTEDVRRLLSQGHMIGILASPWSGQDFTASVVDENRTFDFASPHLDGINPVAELLPYAAVREAMIGRLTPLWAFVDMLREMSDAPIFILSAPSPTKKVTDVEHGVTVDPKLLDLKLPSSALRYKLWKLCEAIYREWCAEKGLTFLEIPPGTTEPDGFRKPEYFGRDWIHASTSYGALVIRQMQAALASSHLEAAQ